MCVTSIRERERESRENCYTVGFRDSEDESVLRVTSINEYELERTNRLLISWHNSQMLIFLFSRLICIHCCCVECSRGLVAWLIRTPCCFRNQRRISRCFSEYQGIHNMSSLLLRAIEPGVLVVLMSTPSYSTHARSEIIDISI